MANIPSKVDGETYSAIEIFKIAGYDNTGGSVGGSVAETTIATVTLSANQLGSAALLLANITFVDTDADTGTHTATFKLKRGATVLQTVTLQRGAHPQFFIGGAFVYVDTGATWSGGITYTITCQLSYNGGSIGNCINLTVIGV